PKSFKTSRMRTHVFWHTLPRSTSPRTTTAIRRPNPESQPSPPTGRRLEARIRETSADVGSLFLRGLSGGT
ncbi:MAG TPA: hypothetical protein P5568_12000, partial [Acidobacteriota bacterium]|nr:hypothetical protein [Acidobacteriota bacterium]